MQVFLLAKKDCPQENNVFCIFCWKLVREKSGPTEERIAAVAVLLPMPDQVYSTFFPQPPQTGQEEAGEHGSTTEEEDEGGSHEHKTNTSEDDGDVTTGLEWEEELTLEAFHLDTTAADLRLRSLWCSTFWAELSSRLLHTTVRAEDRLFLGGLLSSFRGLDFGTTARAELLPCDVLTTLAHLLPSRRSLEGRVLERGPASASVARRTEELKMAVLAEDLIPLRSHRDLSQTRTALLAVEAQSVPAFPCPAIQPSMEEQSRVQDMVRRTEE